MNDKMQRVIHNEHSNYFTKSMYNLHVLFDGTHNYKLICRWHFFFLVNVAVGIHVADTVYK